MILEEIKPIDRKLEEEKDLLLMLVVTLKKKHRKQLNALDLLSTKIISANKEQIKTLQEQVSLLTKSESQVL